MTESYDFMKVPPAPEPRRRRVGFDDLLFIAAVASNTMLAITLGYFAALAVIGVTS